MTMRLKSRGLYHIPPLPGHSEGHVHCAKCEASRQAILYDPEYPQRLFPEAARQWLESRIKISPRTRQDYEQYIRALSGFFGSMVLSSIHIGHVREYQTERSKTLKPQRINQELWLLSKVLQRAGLWAQFDGIYEPLPLPFWQPPRVMTDDEEQRFFCVASHKPEWKLTYLYAVLSNNTGATGSELRGLRLGDVELTANMLAIRNPRLKNKYRVRAIYLVSAAKWALEGLLELARAKGSFAPHHYLFPCRVHKGLWNPDKPMCNTAIGKPWRAIREAAGIPDVVPHMLRHQVNTKLVEAGGDEATVTKVMGHNTTEMFHWYSWPREKHTRELMERALNKKPYAVENMRTERDKSLKARA